MKSPARLVDRRVLAIDWNRESIRIVHASVGRKGPGRVRGVLVPIVEGINVDDPESLGRFIARALRQRRIRTRRAIVAIPRDQAVLHSLSLPNVPIQEMPSVVHFQITKELPFALEEARIDFATFPAEEGAENVGVLVAAVRNDVLKHYQSVCENAGLELERVGLRPFANAVAATYDRSEMQTGCMLFVDVGSVLTEIDLIRNGQLTFSRAASVSVPVLPSARVFEETEDSTAVALPEPSEADQQAAVDNLLVEVNRTIEAYRVTDPETEIDRIIVAGSCGIEQRLCKEVAARFGAPARVYNPGEALPRLADRGDEMVAFSAPLGLTIGQATEGALHFDFLHPKEPVDLSKERARKVPVIAMTAILFAAAVVVAQTRIGGAKKDELDFLKKEISKITRQEKSVEAFKRQVLSCEAWANRERIWLDELAVITELFPGTDQAYVQRFQSKIGGPITLHVKSKQGLEPTRREYEDSRQSPYLAKVLTEKPAHSNINFVRESVLVLTPKPKESKSTVTASPMKRSKR